MIRLIFAFIVWGVAVCSAQEPLLGEEAKPPIRLQSESARMYRSTVINGDTVPQVNLRTVYVVDKMSFKNKDEENKYRRLVRDVKKAYPYAKLAGIRIKEYNSLIQDKNRFQKRRLMRHIEGELKKEFRDDLENLTVKQGRILMKLIDRETGQSSYELVKEFRGSFTAVFWQSFAVIYDDNLNMKVHYDKDGEDRQIENIITLIEKGEL